MGGTHGRQVDLLVVGLAGGDVTHAVVVHVPAVPARVHLHAVKVGLGRAVRRRARRRGGEGGDVGDGGGWLGRVLGVRRWLGAHWAPVVDSQNE